MAMEMDHSFTVPVSPDQAWDVLLDVERIAPCMPGATVDGFDGEVVDGRIKVKVGPVSLTYKGTAKFTERDADAKVIVLDASGKETRGAGTASATVRATLEPESDGTATKATMHTTMNVTGRPAQFGRGVIVEVGGKLVEQFAQNLRQLIADGGAAPAAAAPGAAAAGEAAAAPGTAAPGATAPGATAPGATAPGAAAPGAAAPGATAPGATADEGTEADAGTGPPPVTTAERTPTVPAPVITPAAPAAPASSVSAPPAASSADSINLVRLVGPAILKRVVPVAAGLAALTLIGRRLLRRNAKK